VYVNDRARRELGWEPRYDFRTVLRKLARDEYPRSELSAVIGSKGYHGGP
jgi:UDP-glucose 4-epimerase